MLCADDALAMYLLQMSQKVNQDYVASVLQFVLLYRDCLNQYGWQKIAESDLRELKQPMDDSNIQKRMLLRQDMQKVQEFSACQNAECLPEISNEFIGVYLPQRQGANTLEQQTYVDLTRNLCFWLFVQGFTCSKISLI